MRCTLCLRSMHGNCTLYLSGVYVRRNKMPKSSFHLQTNLLNEQQHCGPYISYVARFL